MNHYITAATEQDGIEYAVNNELDPYVVAQDVNQGYDFYFPATFYVLPGAPQGMINEFEFNVMLSGGDPVVYVEE
jgi:hypothetical protein